MLIKVSSPYYFKMLKQRHNFCSYLNLIFAPLMFSRKERDVISCSYVLMYIFLQRCELL
jgi:hypothetical protein